MQNETDLDDPDLRVTILETAGLFFREYSLRSLQLKDIIQKAKLPRNIFLRYYADKTDLIHAVFEFKLGNAKKRLAEDLENRKQNALELAIEGRSTLLELLKDFPEKTIYELKKYYPELYEKWIQFTEDWLVDLSISNLQLGIRQGVYRKSLNVDLISTYLVKNFIQNSILPHPALNKYSATEFRLQIAEYEFSAICTDKGRALLGKLIGE